jgi:hypothetical protein
VATNKCAMQCNVLPNVMQTVTFDSTARPDDPIVVKAMDAGLHVAFASVSLKEPRGTPDFVVKIRAHELLPELGIFDEGQFGEARFAGQPSSERLENILAIVSNRGFPTNGCQLTKGERHQLRDALILEAHSAAGRKIFVTNDSKAFITNGRRERLEALLGTRILNHSEFESELASHSNRR